MTEYCFWFIKVPFSYASCGEERGGFPPEEGGPCPHCGKSVIYWSSSEDDTE